MYNAQWHLMMAASAVVLAPAVIVFLIGQKYFVEGITMSGLKA
jgi:multiple sugar transport system permease protein